MMKTMDKINNAAQFPKRFYGLHMAEGCAEYRMSETESFKIFINSDTLKKMDQTYEGKPVYVHHVEGEVKPDNIENADGYVVKSFYNQADGKHWVEFIVTTDRGHEAISKGFQLSNSYKIKNRSAGGRWHGIDYHQQITEGEYEHLALVNDPRYRESVIYTPEQFKAYNEQKESELKQLSNSMKKQGESTMFNFFKKAKVENSADLEGMSVVLPKSKKEIELAKLINDADEMAVKKDEPKYANDDDLVKTEEGDKKVSELKEAANCAFRKKNEDAAKAKEEEGKKENESDADMAKRLDLDTLDGKKVNEDEEEKKDKVGENSDHFNKLKNAQDNAIEIDDTINTLSITGAALGKKKYGSN